MCFLSLLALRRGLISNIAAPVVPIQLANNVPTRIIALLIIGVPTNEPVNCTPPEIVNKARRRIMNGMYSIQPMTGT